MKNATVAFQTLCFGHQLLVIPYFYDKDRKYVFEKAKDLLLLSFILLSCAKTMQKPRDLINTY